ncbi:MAG TPA: EAL domain-containing protein [Thermoanaerobaculia bacterium]|nr:EAL domain-containing protein [Thermoanaerobaculia bacterium]
MADRSALNTILQPGGLTPVFQPVFRVDERGASLHGFECLTRGPRGTNFESAKVLFDYVRLKREETVIDRACIAASLEKAAELPPDLHLSLNVHASTLGRDLGFVDFLESSASRCGIAMQNITMEIVEHAPPWDGTSFQSALTSLRAAGATIALDDVGLGYSSFKMILDVAPDYLKVDRHFVDGCATDNRRQAILELLHHLATRFHAELIAEGIETPDDRNLLRSMGVTLMQGYLFSEPLPLADAARLAQNGGRWTASA